MSETTVTTETTVARPRGTRRRRILIVFIVAIFLVLLARTALDFWAGHRIGVEVSRLEDRYGSLDESTLNVPPVPEGENRARAIGAAAGLITYAPQTSWGAIQPSYAEFSRQRPPGPMPADLRAFVETNRAAVGVASDARSRPRSSWEADYATGSNVPRWLDIRTLGNAIYLAALFDLEAGRSDDAARSIASGLAMSASLRQEPILIAQLIRMALAIQHVEAVQRLLVQSEPSKASLEELAKWLAENRAPDPMYVGLLSELKHFNWAMARAESSRDIAAISDGAPPFSSGPLARLARPLTRLARLRYLELMEELLALQAGVRPRPASATAPRWWSPMKRFAHVSRAGLERAMDTGDAFNSGLGVTELAVALRRVRLAHGQYPDALSALVPTYLQDVPIDSFTGKPPVYARQGSGFRLQVEKPKNAFGSTAAVLDWNVVK
jgi:hypothetical protein